MHSLAIGSRFIFVMLLVVFSTNAPAQLPGPRSGAPAARTAAMVGPHRSDEAYSRQQVFALSEVRFSLHPQYGAWPAFERGMADSAGVHSWNWMRFLATNYSGATLCDPSMPYPDVRASLMLTQIVQTNVVANVDAFLPDAFYRRAAKGQSEMLARYVQVCPANEAAVTKMIADVVDTAKVWVAMYAASSPPKVVAPSTQVASTASASVPIVTNLEDPKPSTYSNTASQPSPPVPSSTQTLNQRPSEESIGAASEVPGATTAEPPGPSARAERPVLPKEIEATPPSGTSSGDELSWFSLLVVLGCVASAGLGIWSGLKGGSKARVSNRADSLVGEVVDAVALGALAVIGWWKFIFKVVAGLVVVVLLNVLIQRFVYGYVAPDAGEGFVIITMLFWILLCAATGLTRGARNLSRHGA